MAALCEMPIGISLRLFKMAANLHIMSYTYRDTAPIIQDGGFYINISRYKAVSIPSPLQPHSRHTIPQHPYLAIMTNICVCNYINCFTHIA